MIKSNHVFETHVPVLRMLSDFTNILAVLQAMMAH